MKKLIGLVMMAGLLSAPIAMADEGAGCGLGKQVWTGQSGIVAHVLGATTNGTSANQLSGITSGTSGCDANGVIYRHKEQESFVAANFDVLSQEMAVGHGNSLQSLAALMGCTTPAYADFARMTQQKYEVLFASSETGTPELLSGIKREMSAHPTLSGCSRIS